MEKITFTEKRNELDELLNLVGNYSEKADDNHVHLNLTGPDLTDDDAERAVDVLEEKTKYLPLKRNLTVMVDCNCGDLLDLSKKVKDSIRKQLIPLLYYVDLDLRRLSRVSAAMMVFGVLAMGTASLLSELSFNPYALHEILVIASWVFIWAAVETFFFDRRKLKNRKHHLYRIYFAEFVRTNSK
ncbi:MAG: hypothetical protein JW697_08730 [Kosmotogaceae bacterium]|nr:hypothetical protein [Kosmotogaceae bacterium]